MDGITGTRQGDVSLSRTPRRHAARRLFDGDAAELDVRREARGHRLADVPGDVLRCRIQLIEGRRRVEILVSKRADDPVERVLQRVEVAQQASPWVERQLSEPSREEAELPAWVPFATELEPYREEIMAKLAEFTGDVGVFLAGSLAKLSEGTAQFFFQLFIMLYSMFFFLISGSALLDKILDHVPLSQADRARMVAVGLSVSRATVKGTLIIGAIQGALGGLGIAAAGIDGAVFWGAIMAVLSILPGIGATLVWAPAVAYLMLSDQTLAGVGLFVWSAGVVGTVDNFLRPVLVGRDTEMPDLLILLSTLGGLALFGAAGLVLGPMVAALFLAVLAIYSSVFAEWLDVDGPLESPVPD